MGRVLQGRRDKHHHCRHLSSHHSASHTSPHSELGSVICTVGSYFYSISKPPFRHDLGNILGKRSSLPDRFSGALFCPQASQSHCHIDRGDFQHGFRGGRCWSRHSSTSFSHWAEQLVRFDKRRYASGILRDGTVDNGPCKSHCARCHVSPVFRNNLGKLCNAEKRDVQEECGLHRYYQRSVRNSVHSNIRRWFHVVGAVQHWRVRLPRYLEHPRRLQTV